MVVGRMKFCRDIFRLVYKVDEELAKSAFGKAKNAFHPIARKLIEKVRPLFRLRQALELINHYTYRISISFEGHNV